MVDVIDYVVVLFLILLLTYGLYKQIQHTLIVRKAHKIVSCKRTLFGNWLSCASLAGFLISYTLNVFVAMKLIQSNIMTSDSTSFSSFIFLLIFIIAKFWVIPKTDRRNELFQ